MKKQIVHIINMSGGKDSTACALLAMERLPDDAKKIFVFADTGHEAAETYEYLNYLRGRLNTEIKVAKADLTHKFYKRKRAVAKKWKEKGIDRDIIAQAIRNLKPTGNPFTDMCLLRAGFPSPFARFCTNELKTKPVREQIVDPLIDQGYQVISWLGQRRDESRSRSHTRLLKRVAKGIYDYHPIRHWTQDEVFAYLKSKNVKRNPLYDAGCSRVGCAPCIYAKKSEVAIFATRYPENMDRVAEMERLVSLVAKQPYAAFFNPKNKYFIKRYKQTKKPQLIREVAQWATDKWQEDTLFYTDEDPFEEDEELIDMLRQDCEADGRCE